MFKTAELGQSVSKPDFKRREPILRQELLEVQRDLRELGKFSVIILFGGVDGGGKGETVNVLNEWLDPRWLFTQAYTAPTKEEQARPEYWRFWRDLPPRGQIGLFLSAWYSQPLVDRAYDKIDEAGFDRALDRVIGFEKLLADDGTLILKFWMHLSSDAQKRRLTKLAKNPLTSWRVTKQDWKNWENYARFEEAAERIIMRTSTGNAPWITVEGVDPYYRSLTVGTTIRDAIHKHIKVMCEKEKVAAELKASAQLSSLPQTAAADTAAEAESSAADAATTDAATLGTTVLSTLDMTCKLSKKDYRKKLQEYQAKLNLLSRSAKEQKKGAVIVFEGPDAAGKGGAVRRITAALDARQFRVIPFAAPTDEELAQHYLWRFWRQLSKDGRFHIFDRSWYGRVLVERVEGFAAEREWRRAFAEINDFEQQLTEHGLLLLKFWIHVSKDEQLQRFQAREQTPHKRWKITEEDWRNRESWDEYELAVNDIVEHTSTRATPWVLVEGNDKPYARIKVLKTLCDRLEAALEKK